MPFFIPPSPEEQLQIAPLWGQTVAKKSKNNRLSKFCCACFKSEVGMDGGRGERKVPTPEIRMGMIYNPLKNKGGPHFKEERGKELKGKYCLQPM